MAITFNKANNTTGLYLSGSWTQNALIQPAYIAQFDSTVTTGITVAANAAAANILDIGQLKILNPGGIPTITTGSIRYNTTGEDIIAIDMASSSVNLNHTALIRTNKDITILVGSASNNRTLTYNGGVFIESASVTPSVTFDIAAGSVASSSAVPFQFAAGATVNFVKKGGGTWFTNTNGGTHVYNNILIHSGTVFWNPASVANLFTVAGGLYLGAGSLFKAGQASGTTFGFISDISGAGGVIQKQASTGIGSNIFSIGNTNGVDGYYSGKFENLNVAGVFAITKTGTNKQTFAGDSTSTWIGGASTLAVNGGVMQLWPGALGTTTGNITVTNPGILELSGTQTLTRIIAGTGDLIQTGSGGLILSGANTYNGYTRIDQGSITAGGTAAIGNSILEYTSSRPGTFSFGGQTTQTFGGIQGDKDLALTNANNVAVALTLNSSLYNTAYYGRLTGLGSLTKSGTGILALYSSGAISYSGATNLTAYSRIDVYHSAALGGAGAINFTNDFGALNFYQNTTLNKTYNFTSGVFAYIGAYNGSTLTLTSGSGGGAAVTDNLQQTQGIIQTSTSTNYNGGLYIQPDAGTSFGTTIFRDLTSDASGLPKFRTILSNGIIELSASSMIRTYGDVTNGIRTSRTNDLNYSATNIALGQGFSSINPSGTTIGTNITFAWPPTTSTTLWYGPMLFGTAHSTSTGKTTISGSMNLNGTDQQFYVFNGANANGSIGEISGIISGPGTGSNVNKTGPGTLRLTNKNTYEGLTAVGEGVLESAYIGLQYGSGSSTVGGSILVGSGTTYRYIGSGSQTYATLDLSYGSNTFKFDGVGGVYFPTMSIGPNTVLTGTANQNVVCEVGTINGNHAIALSGSNSWKICGLHPSRSASTTALSGSKLILSTEFVGEGFSLGTGVVNISAGATLETVTGENQSGKAKFNGNLVLGTAGSGAVKATYKIGNGAVKDAGATIVNGNLTFTSATNLQLNNSVIFSGPGEYIIFKYTGTCTGFEFLNPTTNIAGRYVSHMRHDATLKRIYVTLS